MSAMRRAVVRRRPLLRAAAAGGGAYMAGKTAARHSAERPQREAGQARQDAGQDGRDAGISDLEARQAPDPPEQVNKLSSHEDHALTDDEFTAAKARLLALPAARPPQRSAYACCAPLRDRLSPASTSEPTSRALVPRVPMHRLP